MIEAQLAKVVRCFTPRLTIEHKSFAHNWSFKMLARYECSNCMLCGD